MKVAMESTWKVEETQSGQRLDVFCVAQAPHFTRGAIQRAIKEGQVTVNGEAVKPKYLVKKGDVVVLAMKEVARPEVAPQDVVDLPILYEDRHMVVINKPAGVSVHSGQGQEPFTVASWFAERYPDSRTIGDPERPGIVHRLDKDTSGALVLAREEAMYNHLKQQFKQRFAKKEYLALVFGIPGGNDGRITRPLARSKRNPLRRTVDPEGKPAVTEWKLEEKIANKYALLRVFPLTGRTHQIRVHLHFLGFPIVGDKLYTFKRQRPPAGVKRHLLHAEKLTLRLPNGKQKTFTAPLPKDFQQVITLLRSSASRSAGEAI